MSARFLAGAQVGDRGRYEAGPNGAWELIKASPSPRLAGIVESYTGYVERSEQALIRLETPGTVAKLIFTFGVPLHIGVPGGPIEDHRNSFFVPFSAQPAITEFRGEARGLEVSLTPLGAAAVLGQPLDDVPEPAAKLDLLLGPEADRVAEKLDGVARWDDRFAMVEDFLLARLARDPGSPPMLAWAWRQLVGSAGNLAIGDLAAQIGCSPAYLSRSFRRYVGLPPKTAAEILRFDRADRQLSAWARQVPRTSQVEPISLAELAQACGYHDQSHMTRQFRRFAGVTPAAYAGALRPDFLGVPGGS